MVHYLKIFGVVIPKEGTFSRDMAHNVPSIAWHVISLAHCLFSPTGVHYYIEHGRKGCSCIVHYNRVL